MRILDFVRPGGLVAGLLVLAITWIGLRFLRGILDRFGRRFADKRLALEQARTLIGFLLYALGGSLALLLTFHWSREMLLAVGGTIAVAFGIAFKDLAASILAA
ncbi:MAG: hypothetical protein OEY14_01260 [Myxococcales bacterium]|nr:hypothetical protein [Myxococcales bacterium]